MRHSVDPLLLTDQMWISDSCLLLIHKRICYKLGSWSPLTYTHTQSPKTYPVCNKKQQRNTRSQMGGPSHVDKESWWQYWMASSEYLMFFPCLICRYFGFITKHPADHRFACHVFVSENSTKPLAESVGWVGLSASRFPLFMEVVFSLTWLLWCYRSLICS